MSRESMFCASAGQSNQYGLGDKVNLSAGLQAEYPPCTYYYHAIASPADPTVIVDIGPVALQLPQSVFGSEVTYGRDLVSAGIVNLCLIKWTINSAGVEADWLPTYLDPCLDYISAAIAAEGGTDADLRVFDFIGCEGDANALSPATNLEANLQELLDRVLARFPNAHLVLSMLNENMTSLGFVTEAIASQIAFAAANPTTVSVVQTSDLNMTGDPLHYDSPTYHGALEVIGSRKSTQGAPEFLSETGNWTLTSAFRQAIISTSGNYAQKLDAAFGSGSPATYDFKLYRSGSVVSGHGYADVSVTNNSTNFPAATGTVRGVKVTGTVVNWPTCTGSSYEYDEFRVFSAGVEKARSSVDGAPITVDVGEKASLLAGLFQLTLAAQ